MTRFYEKKSGSVGALALAAIAAVGGLTLVAGSHSASAADSFLIGIVEQQLANPFFAKLQQAGVDAAKKHGLETMTAESSVAGDSATQVAAIENMINRGVKGIVLDPANASALVEDRAEGPRCRHHRGHDQHLAGPGDAADASFETDNLAAGELIGKWAKARLGDAGPQSPCWTTISPTRRPRPAMTAS